MQEFITIPTNLIRQSKRGSPFSETDAIIDILTMADENGEIHTSERKLMKQWGWGNSRVRKFLEFLQSQSTIKALVKQSQSTLIVINTDFIGTVQSTSKALLKQSQSTKEEEKPKEDAEIYKRIIGYLNDKCHTCYSAENCDTKEKIDKILNMGYKEEDFYSVIDIKVEEWYGTKWGKYLRPYTLFGDKFENYINQAKRESITESGMEVVEDEEEILTDLDGYTQY